MNFYLSILYVCKFGLKKVFINHTLKFVLIDLVELGFI